MKTDDLENNYKRACSQIEEISTLIKTGKKAEIKPLKLKSDFQQ